MDRSIVRIVGEMQKCAALTVTAAILLSTIAAPQRSSRRPNTGGGSIPEAERTVSAEPKNMLVFPYGVQSFERRENVRIGHPVTDLPGWKIVGNPGVVSAIIVENPAGITQPGKPAKRWLSIDDVGATAAEAMIAPPIHAPAPWNYAWTFTFQVVSAPVSDLDAPVLAIQHYAGGFQDAWGVRLKSAGAELYMTDVWGRPVVLPLFDYTGATGIGEWIQVRVVASLQDHILSAFVNGAEVGWTRFFTPTSTDVTNMRFTYHGSGAGNLTSVLLDDVGVAFLSPLCQEELLVDFTDDDTGASLSDGQIIDTEFGEELTISATGGDPGPVIFDSSNPGPNAPSQDMDLLVNQGNVLIIQTDAAGNPPPVGDFYPNPNDDEDGGTFTFTFLRSIGVQPLTVDLIDLDNRPGEGATITLTDFSALTRTFTVPTDWTGDLTLFQPGVGTLDLQDINPQAGFASVATAVEDAGFDPNAVMSMTVVMGGSGAVDNLHIIIPCDMLDFQAEDDGTPDAAATPLADGQDISTPDEFGIDVSITSAGPNAGAAIFDSTPGGPNDPGPDNDLLVGLGNILILQNNLFATQTTTGFFDTPNDDTNGGDIFFDFISAHCHQVDLIDVDEEEAVGVTVTLLDAGGYTRVYDVPPAWTEDRLNDGPPGFRTLDLEFTGPQPGFVAVATCISDPLFDEDAVIKMTVTFGGAQDMDNLCFCP
jgi:hypothetical protein